MNPEIYIVNPGRIILDRNINVNQIAEIIRRDRNGEGDNQYWNTYETSSLKLSFCRLILGRVLHDMSAKGVIQIVEYTSETILPLKNSSELIWD